ncbi:MAG: hypothetical protein HFE77_07110 [Clostridiales bacterium]|nr:hypothetical protein [Clostridiales bacterium]
MYTQDKPRIYTQSNQKTKKQRKTTKKNLLFGTKPNYHGLDNKTFLRILPCICFALVIFISFVVVANYTKHHSYYLQEDASISTIQFVAKNDIFDEAIDPFEVSIIMDETTFTVPTSQTTVAELIEELNIDLSAKETDIPLDTVVSSASSIYVYDVEYKDNTTTEVLPFETEIVEVSTIPYGTTKVMTKGKNGSVSKTIRSKIIDDQVVSETIIENITTAPVNEIVYKGVGGYYVGDDGVTYHYSHYIDVQATAYTAPSDARTATGAAVSSSVIAVDPNIIPLGTKVYVASDYYDCGVRYALDTGGAVKGNIIDVFMGSDPDAYGRAIQWGRRSARVYFLIDE